MGKHKKKKKNYLVEKELTNEKFHYRVFIGCIVAFLLNYYFLEETVIGDSTKYTIYVFLIPTVVGFFLSAKYFLFKEVWSEAYPKILKEALPKRLLYIIVLFLINGFYAYIIYGMPSHIIWSYVNRKVAEKNPVEHYIAEVRGFHKKSRRSSASISIIFKDRHDRFYVDRDYIKQFLDKNPKDYTIDLTIRKGLWDEYVVEDYNVLRK